MGSSVLKVKIDTFYLLGSDQPILGNCLKVIQVNISVAVSVAKRDSISAAVVVTDADINCRTRQNRSIKPFQFFRRRTQIRD